MELIYKDKAGRDVGFLSDSVNVDFDIGVTNDFELTTTTSNNLLDDGFTIYEDGSELGGIVSTISVDTGSKSLKYGGLTWRGMLTKHIIKPSAGEDYRVVTGTVHSILSALISDFGIGSVFIADADNTTISNFQFDRYCTALSGINKMMASVGRRLSIEYLSFDDKVHLVSKPIVDYSSSIELSEDGNVCMKIKRNNQKVNHLVCLGKGELKDRVTADLYLQADGTIGTVQYYTGIDEVAEVYDYNSAESADDLVAKGKEKFAELIKTDTIETSLSNDINVDLYDILGGRERITGIAVKVAVINKIIKRDKGNVTTSYKVG